MQTNTTRSPFVPLAVVAILTIFFVAGCDNGPADKRIKQFDPGVTAQMAKAIEGQVTPILAEGMTLRLWGVDSLIADPVSIDVDDFGRLYYTRTNRQKNSEFDIRGHQDWEIMSIQIKDIEGKRAFLHKVLAPELSKQNGWMADLNGDGSHDWRDMTVEKEHVYRVEDISGDGIADLSQLIIEDFHDEVTDAAGGVMKYGDDLFVDIGPDLWRLRDNNGDGLIDEKTSLSHGYGIHVGFSGHGMSGIELGPEGKIYWQIGDIGFSGVDQDGKKWEHPNSGVIVRSNPDGSDFEVFSYGNRNTHEFVFDEYGNLISEDNDGDHPGESERIVYITNGSDTGWRTNWQFGKYRDPDNNTYKVWMAEKMYIPRWDGQAAYITPAIANYVNGPTGMLYNPGTALGPEWRNTFFVGEFVGNPTRSGIHSFKLKQKGATFEMFEPKSVLRGVLATGIDFGPDGAMYLADWIDGWDTKDHGRVWKLDVDHPDMKERKEIQDLLSSKFSDFDNEKLEALLKSVDMRVRQKSQFELATRGDNGATVFQKSIDQKENQLARVNAIWGISQLIRKDSKYGRMLLPLLTDSDPEIRAQAAKWLGDTRYKEAGEAIIPLLKDDYSRARFFAAEALGRIAFASAVNPIIAMLESNNEEDAYLRHAGSLALARIGNAEAVTALSSHPSRAVRIAAVVSLRRMGNKGIAAFLQDQDEFVVTEVARGINDDLSIEDALPALGKILSTTPFSNEPLIRRSINANLRVGTEESMQQLINYSQQEGAPLAMRAEAMAALSTWAKPSVVDRVDGRYRGEVTRDPASVRQQSAAPLTKLLNHKEKSIRLQAVKAISKLKIDAPAPLLTKLKTDSDPEVRSAALIALAFIQYPKMDAAISQALSDKEKSVRITGLDMLAKTDLDKDMMVAMLQSVIDTRTREEKQAALTTLGNLPLANTQKAMEQLLGRLEKGTLSPEIRLELAEAIDSTKSESLIARYKSLTSNHSPDSLMMAYEGSLDGGDVDKGRGIFYQNQTAQCIRCHAYNDYGGSAGPRLNGVASRLERKQLLEALIDPSARIAPGFGTVSLDLKGGQSINGILQEEKADRLVLKIGDRPDTTLLKSDIVKRTDGLSSMPPMRFLLSKKEIRDLVSFLATLKEDN